MTFNPSNYDENKAYRNELSSRSDKQRAIDLLFGEFESFADLPLSMQFNIILTTVVTLFAVIVAMVLLLNI